MSLGQQQTAEGHSEAPAPWPKGRRGILVTRPEPGAAETGRRLAALGFEPILAPALLLAPRPFKPPPAQALLLTSRAAARSLAPGEGLPADLPVLAVGEATAAEARSRGFREVVAAEGDGAALVALIAGRLQPAAGPLLLAVGAGYGADLAAALREAGFRVWRRVAYAAVPAPALPGEAIAALKRDNHVVAALFFSPRSARCAVSLLRSAGLAEQAGSVVALAISRRVAAAAASALAPLAWQDIRVAARPDQDALLRLLAPR
jgi:uroporphyrinogen-III synthase